MLTEAQVAELKLKYTRIRVVCGADDEWQVALAMPPKAADIKMYRHQLHDPAQRPDAQEILFRKMVVAAWTEWDGDCDVVKLLERFPMAAEGCSEAVGELIGLAATSRAKT